jgi:hypothetical protein
VVWLAIMMSFNVNCFNIFGIWERRMPHYIVCIKTNITGKMERVQVAKFEVCRYGNLQPWMTELKIASILQVHFPLYVQKLSPPVMTLSRWLCKCCNNWMVWKGTLNCKLESRKNCKELNTHIIMTHNPPDTIYNN